jgi:hypothetical protein
MLLQYLGIIKKFYYLLIILFLQILIDKFQHNKKNELLWMIYMSLKKSGAAAGQSVN